MGRAGHAVAAILLAVSSVSCSGNGVSAPAGREAWKEPAPAARAAPPDASGAPEWHASFRKAFRTPQEALAAMQAREPDAPRAGEKAPDFELEDPAGTRKVRLSSFIGKSPVVLIFGSYT